ncbi:anthranilate synthase component II [Neorhodopirellula lusitana]|uniref:anthranilate synthase component II n=1 Tax=Neorhodopirellula lusitana TaxID=445327 RepID=UPI00384FF052
MLLVIDNYDSFTYNLVQRLGEIDPNVDLKVIRNDDLSLDEVRDLSPSRLLVSPGPCTPKEAGISVECVKHFAGKIPILGVCLGHQSIGQAYGGTIVRAPQLMHGKTDEIHHDNTGLFAGLDTPFVATRYHSLVIDPPTLPAELAMTAWTDTGGTRQIMGVRHREYLMEGWQFHPESFLTQPGIELLTRFLNWS